MMTIDGSYGEGGGQILRTSLALSAITGKDCKIINIRKCRENPGLQEQHLQAINAMKRVCTSTVSGDVKGSTEIIFRPNGIAYGDIKIEISTAGSVGLVLQPLMIVASALEKPLKVEIDGGATNAKWAAPVNYSKNVLLPLLEKMGYRGEIEIKKYGYYPRGGARITGFFCPSEIKKITLVKKEPVARIGGISHASACLSKSRVAERQKECLESFLAGYANEIEVNYCETLCPGSGIDIFAVTKNSIVGASSLGDRGLSAEKVGLMCGTELKKELGGCVDSHAADQLLPYMALGNGKSAILVSEITDHTKTNMWVIEKFLPVKFSVNSNKIECSPI